jgi:hypothetical protein
VTELNLIDLILRICNNHAKPIHIKKFLKDRHEQDLTTTQFKMNFSGAIKTLRHLDLIEEKESQISGDLYITTSDEGHQFIKEYGSYSNYLAQQDQQKGENTRSEKKKKTIENGKIALLFISTLSAVILGWLSYVDNKTIDKYEESTETLVNEKDSLTNRVNELEIEIRTLRPTMPKKHTGDTLK